MGKIVLLTHQKGGVGKSTLAFNLAQNICQNAKVCIVDIDPQGSNASIKDIHDEFEILVNLDFKSIPSLPHDFIFIDTPPYIIDNIEYLYNISDIIIVPTKAGIYDLLAIKKTLEDIKSNDCLDKSMVVFNMIKPNTNIKEQAIENVKNYEVSIAKTIISDYVSFASSVMTKGVENHRKAQKQLDDLTKEILIKI